MALKQPSAAQSTTPAFEDSDTAVAEAPAVAQSVASPAAGAVVPAAKTALAPATGGKFVNIGAKLENALGIVPFGGMTTLKAKSGYVLDDAEVNLGNSVVIDVLSFNYKWAIAPGEEGAEAAKLLRTSYDGVNLDSGGTINDYIAQLKADGYENAKSKERVDVIGVLVSTSKGDYARIGDMVMIDLAPTSVPRFKGQLLQASLKVARKLLTEDQGARMTFTTVPKSGGGNNWSAFDVTGG